MIHGNEKGLSDIVTAKHRDRVAVGMNASPSYLFPSIQVNLGDCVDKTDVTVNIAGASVVVLVEFGIETTYAEQLPSIPAPASYAYRISMPRMFPLVASS